MRARLTPELGAAPAAVVEGSSEQLFGRRTPPQPVSPQPRVVPRLSTPAGVTTGAVATRAATHVCTPDCKGKLSQVDPIKTPWQWACPKANGVIHDCRKTTCLYKKSLKCTNVFVCTLTGRHFIVQPQRICRPLNRRLQTKRVDRRILELTRLEELEEDVGLGILPDAVVPELKRLRTRVEAGEIVTTTPTTVLSVFHQTRSFTPIAVLRENSLMFDVISSIFTHCVHFGEGAEGLNLRSEYEALAHGCTQVWLRMLEVRPFDVTVDDSAAADWLVMQYPREYHVLVVLYHMKTKSGLTVPRFEGDQRRVVMIPPSAFVKRWLPVEKTVKERARVVSTRECSLSSKARAVMGSVGGGALVGAAVKGEEAKKVGKKKRKMPVVPPMFAIDNTGFTKARNTLHSMCSDWVARYWSTL